MGNIDVLLKDGDIQQESLNNSKRFIKTKNKMKSLCKALTMEPQEYDPTKTVENIEEYIRTQEKLDRILYSEISNYVFSLNYSQKATFSTNIEKLLLYSLNDNNISEDCCRIIVKIYDHFQLVVYQIESTSNILLDGVEDAKNNLLDEVRKETEGIEKEYIAILGIFAAIVLTFVGAFTFSTSVLQNIANVNIYRAIIVILLIGLVVLNLLYGLCYYIDRIVRNKNHTAIPLVVINLIISIFIVITIILWNNGFIEKRDDKINNRNYNTTVSTETADVNIE